MSLDIESDKLLAAAAQAEASQAGANDQAPEHDARERERLTAAMNKKTPVWKPVLFLVLIVAGIGTLVAVGAVPRAERKRDIVATNEALRALARRVTIAPIRFSSPTRMLTLPASLRPNASAELFAQATGYVRERKADIGDHVAAGDVLAVLDVPLLHEQLNSARAALAESEAATEVLARNVALAQSTLERWKAIDTPGAVSQQELDERASALESARASLVAGQATIASRKADVQRFERSQEFARIVAPFAGTITARGVELGDYVSGAGGGQALYHIADTSTLRVNVDVPQSFAPGVAVGGAAKISLREQPGRVFQGTIARTSGTLDERTRTLHVEISVPNETGALLAGSYGQVELELARDVRAVIVPGAALLIRAEGPRVALVDAENRLHYVGVRVGRDLGSEVEITEGLTGAERVVVNMADELPEGTVVEPVALPATPAPVPVKETMRPPSPPK